MSAPCSSPRKYLSRIICVVLLSTLLSVSGGTRAEARPKCVVVSKPLEISVSRNWLILDGTVRSTTLRSSLLAAARDVWIDSRIVSSGLRADSCQPEPDSLGDLLPLLRELRRLRYLGFVFVQWGGGGVTLEGVAPRSSEGSLRNAVERAQSYGARSTLDLVHYV